MTTILGNHDFTALYDKGYHTGSEFQTAHNLGVNVLVAIPSQATQAPDPRYNVENFHYDADLDCYKCPEGFTLTTTGKLHQTRTYRFKRYTTKACKSCRAKEKCSKAKYGKAIQRSEYQTLIEQNKQRIEKNENYYRRRQAIVEHPYGTIKRQWGFNYIMTKMGKARAESDFGLVMTAYNLRRIINIVGFEALVKAVKAWLYTIIEKVCSYWQNKASELHQIIYINHRNKKIIAA